MTSILNFQVILNPYKKFEHFSVFHLIQVLFKTTAKMQRVS